MRIAHLSLSVMFLTFLGSFITPAHAQVPAPPADVKAKDLPNDAGHGILLTWKLSPDDKIDMSPRAVIRYEIHRKLEGEQEFNTKVGEPTYQKTSFEDKKCELGKRYFYQIVAVAPDGSRSKPRITTKATIAVMQLFDTRRTWFGIILLLVGGAVVYFIQVAQRGQDLKIRKIAGLEAFNEAVGRATEMGRSCLFIPGILDINDMQTVAGITVLSHVAGLAAEYDARLEVPTSRSLVMTTARETVQAAYLGAGRPDAYVEDNIYYLTDEQFGYVAGVTGSMVRDKPAACFYMGAFFAESLILAETGNAIGAIQVAGTAMPSQLPFFVAACDYTLIGEEFFAASAYLSGEPHQLGSLKGQDFGKVVGTGLLAIGCLFATAAACSQLAGGSELTKTLNTTVDFIKDNILGDKGFLP